MPNSPDRPTRVTLAADGPLLVEGPVEVVGDDGTLYTSRRFTAAICTCRRTRTYPWCDTSHRRRVKPGDQEPRQRNPGEPEKGAGGDRTDGAA
ncbi:CDGSH iron-sulfur domain-containing protein [Streptomyces bacillaris]|uniref:CDGSH iron-sulfur domain-containing protein n=1 Tax=Streptomyces bacillaris TaxID=68179 RepID=UPI00381BDD69